MDGDRSVKTEVRAGNEVETGDFFFFRKRSWEECDLLKEELQGGMLSVKAECNGKLSRPKELGWTVNLRQAIERKMMFVYKLKLVGRLQRYRCQDQERSHR